MWNSIAWSLICWDASFITDQMSIPKGCLSEYCLLGLWRIAELVEHWQTKRSWVTDSAWTHFHPDENIFNLEAREVKMVKKICWHLDTVILKKLIQVTNFLNNTITRGKITFYRLCTNLHNFFTANLMNF